MDRRRAGLEGGVDGEGRRKRLVLDLDGVHPLGGRVLVLPADEDEGITDVVDLPIIEEGLVRERVPDLIVAGDIGGGESREHAVDHEGGLHVDPLDEGVGLGAADDLDHGGSPRDVVGCKLGPAEGLVKGVGPHDAATHDEVVFPPQQVLKNLVILH